MDITPDKVFRKMEANRSPSRHREESEVRQKPPVRETVYIPKNTRDGTYRQLMRSHDRMGTRHLV